jgi:DNA processing protein
MSTPDWAAELGRGLDPELVRTVVTCAASAWATPEGLRKVLAGRLERNASTDVAAVLDELAQPPPGHRVPAPGPGQVEAVARRLLAAGARVLAVGRPGYPPALAQAWPELGAPAWLFLAGVSELPSGSAAAVVGTRRPSLDGLQTARDLGRYLAEAGVPVVSGFARGIDQAGHAGALEGGGETTAVLGTGFGVDYPARCQDLRAQVAGSGGLVTEHVPGAPPAAAHFLWRNRVISGLATVVVVVEGAARSGALQTARLAAAQGREVLAVPGSVNAPTSRGPLALIRDGARTLTCFEDVLEALDLPPPGTASPPRLPPAGLEGDAARVWELLGAVPASAGTLGQAAELPLPRVLAVLANLQSRGFAALTPRGFVAAEGGPARRDPMPRRSRPR